MTPTLMVINLVAEVERLNRQNADLQSVIGTLQADKASVASLATDRINRLTSVLNNALLEVKIGSSLDNEIREALGYEPAITEDPRD